MTKMIDVKIDVTSMNPKLGEDWVNEIVNVYADMEISAVKSSNSSISFKIGLSGIDDTTSDDIKQKIDEYITMTEPFPIHNVTCH